VTPVPRGGDQAPEHGVSVLYDCFLLGQALRPVLARALDGTPLRGEEYAVYSLLAEQGPLSPTVLARRTAMPATTVSDHVRAMTARGHLSREPDPRDARSALLSLTAAGREAWAQTSRSFSLVAGEVEAVLGPHEGPVRAALARLTESLQTVASPTLAHTTDP
jgi:DNA-binding MarR family transcriptional regulator